MTLAQILATAPPVPPIRRTPQPDTRGISEPVKHALMVLAVVKTTQYGTRLT